MVRLLSLRAPAPRRGVAPAVTLAVTLVVASAAARPPAAAAQKKPSATELEKLLASTDEIARMVAAIRGLPARKPITRGVMSKAEVQKRVRQRIEEEYAAIEIAEEERVTKRLGLLDRNADYKQLVLDLYAEQVAGFYDPHSKELYIADWIDPSLQRPVLAHEIDHALQDQSYDLRAFMAPIKDNTDQQLARVALVEGDGLALMVEFTFREMGMKEDPWGQPGMIELIRKQVEAESAGQMKDAPRFLRETMVFPYVGGLALVAEIRRLKPWSAVDALFKRPPVSTEQVLHPEKYFSGEAPLVVQTPKLPSLRGWKQVYKNVFGELGFRIVLAHHGVGEAAAADAAEGWGGDRYAVFAPPGDDGQSIDDLVVVSLSAWDTEVDAAEAEKALTEAMPALAGGGSCGRADAVFRCRDATGDEFTVERKGYRVLVVLGAPATHASKIRRDAWARWKAAAPARR